MKNKIKILMMLAISIILLPTCQKDPDLRMPDLQTTSIPLIEKDAEQNQTIDFLDMPAFAGGVSVDVYYPDDAPANITLMVTMNDDYNNKAMVQQYTSFPGAVDFNLNDLVDLLPGLDSINQLELGDFFRFYAVTTLQDGTVIDGLDTLYNAYGDAIPNLPGSSVDVKYTVVCPFDEAKTFGSYFAYSAPSDWNASGNVTITQDPDDPYTVYLFGMADIEGQNEDGDLIPLHIDPITYEVTADPTVIASVYFDDYHNATFGGTGTYDSCTGTFTIKFNISVTEGNFGTFTFELSMNL